MGNMSQLARTLIVATALSLSPAVLHAQVALDWSASLATPGMDRTSAVVADAQGTLFAAGTTGNAVFVMARDASGNLLWNTRYDAGANANVSAIVLDTSGGVYVAGRSAAPFNSMRTFLSRVDGTGSVLWT